MEMDSMNDADAAHERRATMLTIIIIFLVLTWITVLLRTWVRGFIIRSFGWDDAITLLATVTYTLYAGFNIPLVLWAFGNPHLSLDGIAFISKIATHILTAFALYAATMVIFKISLGIFYLRILISRWQRVTLYITVAISSLSGTFYFFMVLFQCGTPANYLRNALTDNCVGGGQTYIIVGMVTGVINAVSDIILAMLPITVLYKAALEFPAKISAALILFLGCAGSAVSIARIFYIGNLMQSEGWYETGTTITILSAVEAGLCITAASLATLRPLCASCLPSHRRNAPIDSQTQPMVSVSEIIMPDIESNQRRSKRSVLLGWHDKPLLKSPSSVSHAPKTHELDTLDPATEPGVTRKASIRNGKVQWRTPRIETPEPETPPEQPAWKISKPPIAATGAPKIASYDTALRRESRLRRGSLEGLSEMSEPPSPAMERVGVGAWRTK